MASSSHPDPIIERLVEALHALRDGNPAPWSAMFLNMGSMEFPYAPPGYPHRLEGAAAIADYMAGYPAQIRLGQITIDRVLRDGDTRVAEFHAQAHALATGRDYVMHYVSIIEVVDGLIHTYRDYWNPLTALEAIGSLAAFSQTSPAQ